MFLTIERPSYFTTCSVLPSYVGLLQIGCIYQLKAMIYILKRQESVGVKNLGDFFSTFFR